MQSDNGSTAKYFFLQGLTDSPQVQLLLFFPILAMYLLTMLGNCIIVNVIHLDLNLYTPMYFLMGHLAFIDMCYATVITPKMLGNLLLNSQLISYHGCFTQLFFFISFGQSESFLLAVMAYDRYAAICHPLHYTDLISRRSCLRLTVFCWITGFLNSALHTGLAARLPFCSSHQISHFFCDVTPLLKLSCASTFINEVVILTAGVFVVLTPFLCILVSYVFIVKTIMSIPSTTGRHKTFSTCSSHLTVVCMFYGTILLLYMRPASLSQDHDKAFAVIYTLITPFLNPFIYALRNTEIRGSFKKIYANRVLYN